MNRTIYQLLSSFLLLAFLGTSAAYGQDAVQLALEQLSQEKASWKISQSDIDQLRLSDQYEDRQNGITYLYFQQTLQGREVKWGTANAVVKDGRLFNVNARLIGFIESKLVSNSQQLSAEDAVRQLASLLEVPLPAQLQALTQGTDAEKRTTFDPGSFALEPVKAQLIYHVDREESVRLAWEVTFYEKSGQHHWYVHLDAHSGDLLLKKDYVLHCEFGHPGHTGACQGYDFRPMKKANFPTKSQAAERVVGNAFAGGYLVFPMPVESPNHGDQEVVSDPDDPNASPFGWHDTDGAAGVEYTITRGNNVHAYEDTQDNNASIGNEPDGGSSLTFNYPFDPGATSDEIQDAAVVNLFYWCNIMHDVFYQYGFDEPAGNFQANNYGNGGEEGDFIRGEAQDGSGTNNANFSSSGDGTSARIQMYLWTSGGGTPPQLMTVNAPGSIAGQYGAVEALFGPGLPDMPLTGDLILADDGSGANSSLACFPIVNGDDISGNIALIDRGICNFVQKVENAQEQGAIAVVICNDAGGNPIAMGGDGPDVVIPSVMIGQADCNTIKAELANGVNITLDGNVSGGIADFKDGDFDSGIICHEYGHGLSIRMTGGPGTGACLFNDEQMGEGWSDYVGLMLTMRPDDTGADIRGIGTYAINEPIDGDGIRPAPYSTDFAINDYTYGNVNGGALSQPHGIGFVWCTMLWEMTWDLIEVYGFDEDFYYGTGGNNIALKLVTEGMKLQTCNPGFVDGRDAILLADQLFFNGENQCLIWEAFARRGLGASADQGSSFDRNDQVEAFDLPFLCQEAIMPPTASFVVDATENCSGIFLFTNNSFDIPQMVSWNFGDGTTSEEFSPSHTYTEEGTYEVILTVSNTLGMDSDTITLTVDFPDAPTPDAATVCEGVSATLTASGSGYYQWYLNGEVVFEGNEFATPPVAPGSIFEVATAEPNDLFTGGPADNNFGTGGYHSTGFTGTVVFEAHKPFILESVFVDAGSPGNRLIQLFDNQGDVIDEVTVFMPQGPSQVALGLEIPSPGNYQVGGTSIDLYRNDSGANYPYEISDIVTLIGSPAGEDFYYYLYNWEVRETPCLSERVPVDVTILPAPAVDFDFELAGSTVLFTDLSSNAVTWNWDFGDGGTSSQQFPEHTYSQDGIYQVTLTISDGNCESTLIKEVEIALVEVTEIESLQRFELFPVPGDGDPTLSLAFAQPEDVTLKVYNSLGQLVWLDEQKSVSVYNKRLELTDQAAGTYFISVLVDGKSAYKRYVLMK